MPYGSSQPIRLDTDLGVAAKEGRTALTNDGAPFGSSHDPGRTSHRPRHTWAASGSGHPH